VARRGRRAEFYAVVFVLSALSCASIVSGTTQEIEVTSVPPGARVTAEPGDLSVRTPDVLKLRRKEAPYRLTFSMDGYEPYSVTIASNTNGWVWGNLIIGGLIGIVVDYSTGAAEALSPKQVHANLIENRVSSEADDQALYVFSEEGRLMAVLQLEQ